MYITVKNPTQTGTGWTWAKPFRGIGTVMPKSLKCHPDLENATCQKASNISGTHLIRRKKCKLPLTFPIFTTN